jgi:ferredoxin
MFRTVLSRVATLSRSVSSSASSHATLSSSSSFATAHSAARALSTDAAAPPTKAKVKVSFKFPNDEYEDVVADEGDSVLEVAHANDIELEGACDGAIACSTCHVVLSDKVFSMLPEADEEEEDMLDMAAGLTKTSRLGCQVLIRPEMQGMTITLPSEVSTVPKKSGRRVVKIHYLTCTVRTQTHTHTHTRTHTTYR